MLENKSLKSFSLDLASSSATPGGGAATALSGANGTAMILMAINLSEKYLNNDEDKQSLNQSRLQLDKIQHQFLHLIDADAEAFKPLSKALRLPTDTDEAKEKKKKEMIAGVTRANQPPLECISLAKKVIQIIDKIKDLINPMLLSDYGIGLQLLRTTILSSELTLSVNYNLLMKYESVESSEKDFEISSLIANIDTMYLHLKTEL